MTCSHLQCKSRWFVSTNVLGRKDKEGFGPHHLKIMRYAVKQTATNIVNSRTKTSSVLSFVNSEGPGTLK